MKQFKVITTDDNDEVTTMNLEGKSLEVFKEVFADKQFNDRMDFLYAKFVDKLGEEISKLDFAEMIQMWKTMQS